MSGGSVCPAAVTPQERMPSAGPGLRDTWKCPAWYPRIPVGWKGFKAHPVPPCAMGRSYPSLLHALSSLALDASRIRTLKPLWATSQEHWLFSLSAFLFPWRRGLLRSAWEEKCARRDPRGSRSCKHLFKERFYLFIPPGELQ